MTKYEILKLGLNLVSGGLAEVGKVYDRNKLKMSDFTRNKRIDGGWMKEVDADFEPEPTPEPKMATLLDGTKVLVEDEPEEVAEEEPEEEPESESDVDPTEETREGLTIEEYWSTAEVPEGYKKKRICPECGDICSGKSELFDHCREEAEAE